MHLTLDTPDTLLALLSDAIPDGHILGRARVVQQPVLDIRVSTKGKAAVVAHVAAFYRARVARVSMCTLLLLLGSYEAPGDILQMRYLLLESLLKLLIGKLLPVPLCGFSSQVHSPVAEELFRLLGELPASLQKALQGLRDAFREEAPLRLLKLLPGPPDTVLDFLDVCLDAPLVACLLIPPQLGLRLRSRPTTFRRTTVKVAEGHPTALAVG
mmetsp:Transcript_70714/g.113981  ORF Transcript_70714/g.113981 Transcript_70714/m.113981 type:complete len:213 (+) Transcript_70714:381-1019(+)